MSHSARAPFNKKFDRRARAVNSRAALAPSQMKSPGEIPRRRKFKMKIRGSARLEGGAWKSDSKESRPPGYE